MANSEFTATSLTYTEADGVITVHANWEGTAEGFGTVHGTASFQPAGATSGTYNGVWVSYGRASHRRRGG